MRPPPLCDLHRHLDGSLREATLRELAAGLGVEVPEPFRFRRGMGLAAALRCFDLSLAVLQSPAAVRRVADECCADAAGEGVTTVELRFAPQLHGGASPEAIVEAAADRRPGARASAWAAPRTRGRGGRRPRSGRRWSTCTRSGSATARPCRTTRPCSTSCASGA